MKFYAPYKNFRVMIGGRVLRFPNAVRTVQDNNLDEIKAIKSIPIELGEIRDVSGEVVNKSQITTPKAKPAARKKLAKAKSKKHQG